MTIDVKRLRELLASMDVSLPWTDSDGLVLDCEKCRATSGDEGFMTALQKRPPIATLRAALREALDGWQAAMDLRDTDRRTGSERRDEARIAELRKLAEDS